MNFLDLIAAITTFQLFQLGVILMISKQGFSLSNRILSAFMFFNSFLIAWFAFGSKIIPGIPIGPFFYFLLAPYLYLYVKALCRQLGKRSVRELYHWIPAFIGLGFGMWKPEEFVILQIFLDLQIAIYLFFIFRIIITYRQDIREHFSSIREIDLFWLLFILVAFVIMWLVDVSGLFLTDYNTLAIISISINFIFATSIVYRGIRHPKVFSGYKESPKYSGSGLSSEKTSAYAKTVTQFMAKEKPYLNPDLTIKQLADQLSIHPKSLSQVINSRFNMNFFDFINHYRIKEAKRKIIEGGYRTVLEILYEVGYNSKSAFNEAFKRETKMTPTEFRKMQKNGSIS